MGWSLKKIIPKKVYSPVNKIFGPESWKTGASIAGGVGLFKALGGAGGSGGKGGLNVGSLLPSIIGAGANIYSARQVAKGQASANDQTLQSARERMAFEERMSSTAHQREVEDLKKAGLNPVLSANHGGASTPTGANVEFGNEAPDYSDVGTKAVNTAIQMAQIKKNFELMDEDIKNRKETNKLIRNQSQVQEAEKKLKDADFYLKHIHNAFWADHPKLFRMKKFMESWNPLLQTGTNAAIIYRAIKGFSPEMTEEFDSQGTHRRTTIRSKGGWKK